MRPLALPLLLAPLAGCGLASDLVRVQVEGTIEIDGTAPGAYSLQLYSKSDNPDAFDTSWCLDQGDEDCFGRIDVAALDTPATASDGGALPVEWDGDTFTLSDVPGDLLYVLVATGDDDTILCTTDVVGFDEDTKVVTSSSAITLSVDEGLDTFTLPRAVELSCAAPATAPDAGDGEPGDNNGGDDIPAGDDPEASWTSFVVSGEDASAGNISSDLACGSSFPSVLTLSAELSDTSATEAWLRIQFGSGESASFQTVEVPVVNGRVDQKFSLTGGYAVVQLDTDDQLDGVGESYTISYCDQADPPGQEMLVLVTWDKDDTDVDTHVFSEGAEVAYYSMSQPWGDLDIDDTDGFGPETFTSTPGTEGNLYEVKVHYYSDHGNGPTTATVRVVHHDSTTGETCDLTTSKQLNSYDWWTVGAFGPGLSCPE